MKQGQTLLHDWGQMLTVHSQAKMFFRCTLQGLLFGALLRVTPLHCPLTMRGTSCMTPSYAPVAPSHVMQAAQPELSAVQ